MWREAAEAFADEVTTDKLGTTVARVNGRGEHPLMAVVGHIDEIALLVSHVTDKGFLHVVQSGGWDAQVLVSQRVEVLTRDGSCRAWWAASRRTSRTRRSARRPSSSRTCTWTSARRTATRRARWWPIGDQVLIAAEPVELPNGRIASRALDNRLGVYVAIEVARRVKEAGGGGGPVAGVAAVQEEIGAHGARVMAYGLEPDLAVVVDVTHATDAPGVDPAEIGEHGLGSGPVVTRGAIVSRTVNDLLAEAAEAEGIEYATEVSGGATPAPTPTRSTSAAPASPPRSSRSRCATCTRRSRWCELDDVENTIRLLTALALRLEADTSLARW